MFCEGVKYLFDSLKCNSIYNFFKMRFSGFFLSLTVQINLPKNYRLIMSLSVGKRTKSAGDQIFFPPHCMYQLPKLIVTELTKTSTNLFIQQTFSIIVHQLSKDKYFITVLIRYSKLSVSDFVCNQCNQ